MSCVDSNSGRKEESKDVDFREHGEEIVVYVSEDGGNGASLVCLIPKPERGFYSSDTAAGKYYTAIFYGQRR